VKRGVGRVTYRAVFLGPNFKKILGGGDKDEKAMFERKTCRTESKKEEKIGGMASYGARFESGVYRLKKKRN